MRKSMCMEACAMFMRIDACAVAHFGAVLYSQLLMNDLLTNEFPMKAAADSLR